jgi:hypothetical protein
MDLAESRCEGETGRSRDIDFVHYSISKKTMLLFGAGGVSISSSDPPLFDFPLT